MLANASQDFLFEIIQRLSDPVYVKSVSTDSNNVISDSLQGPAWNDLSLANGYPSLLLLFSTLYQKNLIDSKNESVIHAYVLKIKEAIETQGLSSLSLYGGVTGICFSIKEASCNGSKYQRLLNILEDYLLKKIQEKYLDPLQEIIQNGNSAHSFYYDTIQGLSGIGRYALENLASPKFQNLVQKICEILIAISQPKVIKGYLVPGWHVPSKDPTNSLRPSQELNGNFNFGLSHGVSGILAFLSIASLKGVTVTDQIDTIRLISDYLCKRSIEREGIPQWPGSVSWEEEVGIIPFANEPSRDAWCYGVPGISRSLFLAGKAIKDSAIKNFAGQSFRGIFHRTPQQWFLPGPGICHGISGLLLATNEMIKEEGYDDLKKNSIELQKRLISFYKPLSPFGFKNLEPNSKGELIELDNPGFLEGSSGIIMTLLLSSDPNANWHLPFLIHA